eukprot:CAMPEP_0185254854 /NCGR_PEP_ID=MMETSP1359-20130426/3800_1 /TAXON_ID=552665 /ORGANISM="Bigelowiella longifila, Strain CCMP242" /LENGTH=356 /DNA_ID=CAMNT_0027838297 /DNA_START=56 /DNA_END=1126 /DNA_ORIENTATION=-
MGDEETLAVSVRWEVPFGGSREELVKLSTDAKLSQLHAAVQKLIRHSAKFSLWLGHPPRHDLSVFPSATPVSAVCSNLATLTVKSQGNPDASSKKGTASYQKYSSYSALPSDKGAENSHMHKEETDFSKMLDSGSGPTHAKREEGKTKQRRIISVRSLLDDGTDKEHLFVASAFLSPGECKKLIAASEDAGYEDLGWNKSYRSNDRVVLKDTKLANAFYERLAPLLPLEIKDEKDNTWKRCGLNECFRYCRYKKGQLFKKHTDGNFVRSDSEASIFTVNIYLNGHPDFEGGATRFFLNQEDSEKVTTALKPKCGDALVFNHSTKCYLHDGERLESGVKYLLRTDAMYKLVESNAEA